MRRRGRIGVSGPTVTAAVLLTRESLRDSQTFMSATRLASDVSDIETRLQAALERIRPAMQMDGGDIHLVGFTPEDGIVRVALSGACNGCHMSSMTMTLGVERVLKQLVPEVRAVEAV